MNFAHFLLYFKIDNRKLATVVGSLVYVDVLKNFREKVCHGTVKPVLSGNSKKDQNLFLKIIA